MFNALVSVFIFLTACAYIPGQGFGTTQLLVFKIGVPILWLTGLCLKPKRCVQNLWLNALVGYAFIQTLLLHGKPQAIALEPLVYVFLGLILYYTIANHLKDIKPLLNGLCWAVAFQAIIVILQCTGLDPICLNDGGEHNTHLVGLFGAKYVFGAWMALATPILLFNRRKFFGVLSAILCICSMSWASIGFMFGSLVIGGYFAHNRRTFLLSLLPITLSLILIYAFVLHRPDNYVLSFKYKAQTRIHLQSKFLPVLFAKPITGYGLGSFKYIGPQIVNPKTGRFGTMTDAWNDYLERSMEVGLPFIALFGFLCYDMIRRFKRFTVDKQMVGIMCSCLIIPFGMLFHDYMNHASINTLIICLLSAFAIKGGLTNSTEPA